MPLVSACTYPRSTALSITRDVIDCTHISTTESAAHGASVQNICYLLGSRSAGVGVLIDPGAEPETILTAVQHRERDCGLRITHILLSRAHILTFLAARQLAEATGALVCLHAADLHLWRLRRGDQCLAFGITDTAGGRSAESSSRLLAEGDPDVILSAGDVVGNRSLDLQVLHTPGVTPGSCCFYSLSQRLLFTGGTLQRGSCGRLDMGGDSAALAQSLQEELVPLLVGLDDESELETQGGGTRGKTTEPKWIWQSQ